MPRDHVLDERTGEFTVAYLKPVLIAVGGVGPSSALQTLTVPVSPADRVYKPNGIGFSILQPNLQDEAQGDMVSGMFLGGTNHSEDTGYNRVDFTPRNANDTTSQPSILVRMRRTDDRSDALNDIPGVSSPGPSFPLLFGRGALIGSPDPTQIDAPRVHGLTIRATAIADARRAKSIGPAYLDTLYPGHMPRFADMNGASPFALLVGFWSGLTANTADTLTVAADGTITSQTTGGNGGSLIRDFLRHPYPDSN